MSMERWKIPSRAMTPSEAAAALLLVVALVRSEADRENARSTSPTREVPSGSLERSGRRTRERAT